MGEGKDGEPPEPPKLGDVLNVPMDQEPKIPMCHLTIFTLLATTSSLISGGMGVVRVEYTQHLGVNIFFQTMITLAIGPLVGYVGLAAGYLSDQVNNKRFGRRKPILLPTMLLQTVGLIFMFMPPKLVKDMASIPAWWFTANLLLKVSYVAQDIIMAWIGYQERGIYHDSKAIKLMHGL